MSRLFTALTVSEELKRRAGAMPQEEIGGNWTHPEDLHITIRFLGEVSQSRLPEVKEALAFVRRPPFHLSIKGLGLFENRKQTILYAAVESTRKLTTLCAEITDKLTPLGFDFGTRPYVPHMTLARLHAGARPEKFLRRHGGFTAAPWLVTSFHLVESAPPDDRGRRYQSLEEYRLF